jgi:hypothetical protein
MNKVISVMAWRILFILMLHQIVYGQSVCTQTSVPGEIFYPNSVSTATTIGLKYLCGPNTTVYDTASTYCYYYYVDSYSSLFLKGNCSGNHAVCVKSTSTLTILPGVNSDTYVIYEAGATISNLSGSTIYPTLCTKIVYTSASCGATYIGQNNSGEKLLIWPNPTSTKINIEFSGLVNQVADITIINQIGTIIREYKQWLLTNKEIPIDDLSNGSYFISVKTELAQKIEKLIIVR